jgi:hypothetical protein
MTDRRSGVSASLPALARGDERCLILGGEPKALNASALRVLCAGTANHNFKQREQSWCSVE